MYVSDLHVFAMYVYGTWGGCRMGVMCTYVLTYMYVLLGFHVCCIIGSKIC